MNKNITLLRIFCCSFLLAVGPSCAPALSKRVGVQSAGNNNGVVEVIRGKSYNLARSAIVVRLKKDVFSKTEELIIEIGVNASKDPDFEYGLEDRSGHLLVDTALAVKTSVQQPGLLQSISYSRKPRTAEAIGLIANAAIQFATTGGLKGDGGILDENKVFETIIYIDSKKNGIWSRRSVNAGFKPVKFAGGNTTQDVGNYTLKVEVKYPESMQGRAVSMVNSNRQGDYAEQLARKAENEIGKKGVVLYRPLVPVEVLVTLFKKGTNVIVKQRQVELLCVDPTQLFGFRFPTIYAAKKAFELDFYDGALLSVESSVDSEIYSAVSGVLAPANAGVGVVSGIFTVNVHHDGESKSGGGSKESGTGRNVREKD